MEVEFMNTPNDFGFIAATNADQRMSALESFIVFWRGPRLEAQGESESRLNSHSLPISLLRLQKFAGRWTCPHPDLNEDVQIFAIQDHVRTLDQLEISDGKLIFLDENSGNAVAATLPQGDDPPVWVAECLGLKHRGPWRIVSDSLSETLVSIALQELFYGSSRCLADTSIDRWLHSSRSDVVTLLNGIAHPFTESSTRYSLWEGSVMIREAGGAIAYAANHEEGIAFLNEHQGEIERVRVGLQGLATLTIESDGAAEVDFLNIVNASGHAPQGTFDFGVERDRVLALSSVTVEASDPWYVQFPRTGQFTCRSLGIRDIGHARSLLNKAINAVTFKSSHFDEQLKRLPRL